MKKLITAGYAVAAVLASTMVCGADKVPGESLDSGLGSLPASYAADEYSKKRDGAVEWPFAL